MLIGCDLDGVVVDFTTEVNRWVTENFGHDPIEPTHWDWVHDYPDGRMVFRSFWNKGVADGAFLRCPEIPGAVESLKRLIEDGFEVVFITHRNPTNDRIAHDTATWLDERGLPVNVAFLKEKSLVAADLYVDDKVETVEGLLTDGWDALLFDQPWNQGVDLPRVEGWNALEWHLTGEFTPEAK